jgi:hypothetical protein
MQTTTNTKAKTTQSNYPYSQQNQSQSYYNSLSAMGTNGTHYPSASNTHTTKNGPMPFLPRISGASAFSNYSTNTGNSSSINNKVKQIEYFQYLRTDQVPETRKSRSLYFEGGFTLIS